MRKEGSGSIVRIWTVEGRWFDVKIHQGIEEAQAEMEPFDGEANFGLEIPSGETSLFVDKKKVVAWAVIGEW